MRRSAGSAYRAAAALPPPPASSLRPRLAKRISCPRWAWRQVHGQQPPLPPAVQQGGADIERLIREHTALETVEGVRLHLITEACELYHHRDEATLPFPAPWWAFCWPGGRGLTRYLMENPGVVKGRRVLDIGSGCGSASVACVLGGAREVVANDIDPFAQAALRLNLESNGASREAALFCQDDLIGQESSVFNEFDVVLVGDMLYDPDFSGALIASLAQHQCVLFGDPGREYCPRDISPEQELASYAYGQDGFSSIKVFKLH